MAEYVKTLEESFQKAEDKVGVEELSMRFFGRFFETFPETSDLFKGTNIDYFRKFKMRTIFVFFIDIVKHPNYAEAHIAQEVMRHQMYGLTDKEYYFALTGCLLEAVKSTLGDEWTEEYETAWNDILLVFRGLVSQAVDSYL